MYFSSRYINKLKEFRKKEYYKLVAWEKGKKCAYYLPVGVNKEVWHEFRKNCTEEELKNWFGVNNI